MLIAEQQKLFDYLPDEIEQNEFILFDRLEKIKQIIEMYGEENFYLSFSGGKDSTVLHYLLDMAIPDNKIPRVFSNTGLEYREIYKFVKNLQDKDNRIIMLATRKNIVKTLERVGYPFKSKKHSEIVEMYQKGSTAPSIERYLSKGGGQFGCPKVLRYHFTPECKLKISARCCNEFKKDAFNDWIKLKENKKSILITGMRKEEGGHRVDINCIVIKKSGQVTRFHPLAVVTDAWENWFIDTYGIQLCDLYYYPYNFERTGCVGCPFKINIEKELEILKEKLPNEYRRAWLYFGPVYREYQRIGYRFKGEVKP